MVVNLSGSPSQGFVRLPWSDVRDKSITLEDLFSGARYNRQGIEMTEPGLFVDLPVWGYHFFEFSIVASEALDRIIEGLGRLRPEPINPNPEYARPGDMSLSKSPAIATGFALKRRHA